MDWVITYIEDHNLKYLLHLSMLNEPLMLKVNWPVVDTTHLQSSKLVMDMKIKVSDDSKCNDSPPQWYQMKSSYKVLTIQQELILCSAGSDEPHMSHRPEELLQS